MPIVAPAHLYMCSWRSLSCNAPSFPAHQPHLSPQSQSQASSSICWAPHWLCLAHPPHSHSILSPTNGKCFSLPSPSPHSTCSDFHFSKTSASPEFGWKYQRIKQTVERGSERQTDNDCCIVWRNHTDNAASSQWGAKSFSLFLWLKEYFIIPFILQHLPLKATTLSCICVIERALLLNVLWSVALFPK